MRQFRTELLLPALTQSNPRPSDHAPPASRCRSEVDEAQQVQASPFFSPRVGVILTAFLLLFIVTCTEPSSVGDDSFQIVNLGTHGLGTVLNVVGTGMAAVLSENLSLEFRALATSGPTEWLPMIVSGEVEFGVLNVWDSRAAWRGDSIYRELSGGQGFPIRLIAGGNRALAGIVVAEDSGIREVTELKGKRFVGNYTGAAGLTAEAQALLANHGLTYEDVSVVTVPGVSAGVRAVLEGRADANGANIIGMGVVSELDAARGARFLSSDPSPEAVSRLQAFFPGHMVKVTPGPDKTGVREELYMMGFDFYLVGRTNLPEDLVDEVIRTLWERNSRLVSINHQLKDWAKENFVKSDNQIPYHPVAIKFYKEKGVWTPQAEVNQQKLVAIRDGATG